MGTSTKQNTMSIRNIDCDGPRAESPTSQSRWVRCALHTRRRSEGKGEYSGRQSAKVMFGASAWVNFQTRRVSASECGVEKISTSVWVARLSKSADTPTTDSERQGKRVAVTPSRSRSQRGAYHQEHPSPRKTTRVAPSMPPGLARIKRFSSYCVIDFTRSGRSQGKISDRSRNRPRKNHWEGGTTSTRFKPQLSMNSVAGSVMLVREISSRTTLFCDDIKQGELVKGRWRSKRCRILVRNCAARLRAFAELDPRRNVGIVARLGQ